MQGFGMKKMRILSVILASYLSFATSLQAAGAEKQESRCEVYSRKLLTPVFAAPLYLGFFLKVQYAKFAGYMPIQKAASTTAEEVAGMRAAFHGVGLCHDGLAKKFIPRKGQVISALFRGYYWAWGDTPLQSITAGMGGIAARSNRGDAILQEFVKRAREAHRHVSVVVLGAGYDTRAYRLPEAKETFVSFFEVDAASTQDRKLKRLNDLQIDSRHVHYVAVDFTRDNFLENLKKHGFNAEEPTLFLWEGVSMYLSKKDVKEVLTLVSTTAPGSQIYFDVIRDIFSENARNVTWNEKMVVDAVKGLGEPYRFGLSDVSHKTLRGLLAESGLELFEFWDRKRIEKEYFVRARDKRQIAGSPDYMALVLGKVPDFNLP